MALSYNPFTKLITTLRRRWGFWSGLILFFVALLIPVSDTLNVSERNMIAITLLMAIWWMSEALPLAVTSLLPLALYPLLGIMKTGEVAPNYSNHLVFLFMGGFIIAIALQEWKLHKRFALFTIALIGNNARRMILAFMLATALLSMWISNTATAIMMLPIGLAVIGQIYDSKTGGSAAPNRFGTILMLGIAYSASIGGIGTLIGTPPNVVFAGIYEKYFPSLPEITFVRWMIYAIPLVVLLFIALWFYLTHIAIRKKDLPVMKEKSYFKTKLKELGTMTVPQKWVLWIFVTTALLWIFRSDIQLGFVTIRGWPNLFGLQNVIQDSTIAVGMAILLFTIPVRDNNKIRNLLTLKNLMELPWDILILFGGGFALADGIQKTGLAEYLGQHLVFLQGLSFFPMLFVLTISISFLTEFTSNTAVATTLLPIFAALSIELKMSPLLIMLPATVAASCAFMLPVATPPNAIVFGSRYVPIKKMVRVGFVFNFISALIVSAYFYVVFKLM